MSLKYFCMKKIFNKNRIIIYDPFNEDSLQKTLNFITNITNNEKKLFEFYQQNPFQEHAFKVI